MFCFDLILRRFRNLNPPPSAAAPTISPGSTQNSPSASAEQDRAERENQWRLEQENQFYNEIQDVTRYESELIHRRLTWLLTSQTLIFAGIGAASASAKEGAFQLIFISGCAVGFVTSVGLLLGVSAAIYEIHRAYSKLEEFCRNCNSNLSAIDKRPLATRRQDSPWTMFAGEGVALLLPLNFVIVWGGLGGRYVWWHKNPHFFYNNDRAFLSGIVALSLLAPPIITLFITPGLRAKLCKKT